MRSLRRTVPAAVLMLSVLGCAPLPLAPSAETHVREARPLGTSNLPLPVPPISSSLTLEQPVSGLVGGTLTLGRVSLTVPKHAFDGTGLIKITIPDTTKLRVELHIDGVANDFKEPLTLQIRWAGSAWAHDFDPNALSIVWFNEASRRWVRVPSTVDVARGTVRTGLPHFSIYDVVEAKAGW